MWYKALFSIVAFFIILIGAAPSSAFESVPPGPAPTAAIYAVKPERPVSTSAMAALFEANFGQDWSRWIAADQEGTWSASDLLLVRAILDNTLAALADVGLDGAKLLEGYRFKRLAGEFVRPEARIAALVNHSEQIISLGDAAFVRQQGFYIYHELGHAVDHRLGRRLDDQFHKVAGSGYIEANGDRNWFTADGYWLRPIAHETRSEATADAFGLWVSTVYGGSRRPVFAGISTPIDYDSIVAVIRGALEAGG